MKKSLFKSFNWILTGLIGILGFAISGCPMRVEYGVPNAKYTVKGRVVSEANDPIEGIRVGFSPKVWDEDIFDPPPEYYDYSPDPYVMTNAEGGFTLTTSGFPSANKTLNVYVEDTENGLFQPKMFPVDFSGVKPVGGSGNWYEGEYTVTRTFQLAKIEIDE